MSESRFEACEAPSALEQMGALGSLLVHELANLLCIISGNATFAQLSLDDPERLAGALDAVVKAGERASQLLTQCGRLRREIIGQLATGDAAAAIRGLEVMASRCPGWPIEVREAADGPMAVPTAWVPLIVRHAIEEVGASEGTIRVDVVEAAASGFEFPVAERFLEIRLVYGGGKTLSMQDARSAYENFGLLAAFELIRGAGGGVEGRGGGAAASEVVVLVPLGTGQGEGSAEDRGSDRAL